jgi:uncharacterized OsmC-like protein
MEQKPAPTGEIVNEVTLDVEQQQDYQFLVRFGKDYGDVLMDEPPPLGQEAGPSPARMLAAAVGGCLSASLLFSTRKAKVDLGKIRARVRVGIGRNENRRLRVKRIAVEIEAAVNPAQAAEFQRCVEVFEDFCTITESVRAGIPVEVKVHSPE